MPTTVGINSPIARKLYSVALFAETQRKKTFRNQMIGPAPKQSAAERQMKGQSSADYPFVRVTDLSQGKGDKVSIDLFNIIQGRPTMGDKKLTGRLMSLSHSSQDVRIDQMRGGVDTGGRMAQHRTVHQLRGIAKANLVGWNSRAEDQLALIHVAGARGDQDDKTWVIPLDSDPEFNDIVVNALLPPSYARRVIAGGGDSVTAIGTTDALALEDIDRLRAILDDLAFPLQPIKLDTDQAADDDPLFCLYVTSRQWHFIQTNTSNLVWRTFLSNAAARAASIKEGTRHPLFTGQTGLWNGILMKKTNYAVRFNSGTLVSEENAAKTVVQTAAPQPIDRAILLGAQALCVAYGRHGSSKQPYSWHEELTDHDNTLEVSTAMIGGYEKIRFTDSDGVVNDHGVMVIDSYAPAIT